MLNAYRKLKGISIIVTLSAFVALAWDANKPFIIADDCCSPPYAYFDENGQPRGITIDIWKLWSKKSGIPIEFRLMNWDSALVQVRDGRADALGFAYKTSERELLYDFPRPLLQITTGVFFHKNLEGFQRMEDLANQRIGMVTGDAAQEFIRKSIPSAQIIEFPNTDSLVRAADNNTIRILVGDAHSVLFYLSKSEHGNEFRQASQFNRNEIGYIAIPKNHPEIYAIVNEGFEKVSPQEMETIFERWEGRAITQGIPWKKIVAVTGALGVLILFILFWNLDLRRRIRKAVQKSQEQAEQIQYMMRESPVPLLLATNDGRTLQMSHQFVELLGYDLSTIPHINEWWIRAYPDPEYRKQAQQIWSESVVHKSGSEDIVLPREYVITTAKGKPLNLVVGATIFRDNILVSFTDITPIRNMENSLRESDLRYRLVVEGTMDAIWDYRIDTHEFFLSPRWEQMLGYESNELTMDHADWVKICHPDDLGKLQHFIDSIEKGVNLSQWSLDYRVFRKNKETLWIQSKGGVVAWDCFGKPVRYAGTMSDITARILYEEKRQQLITQLEDRGRELERFNYAVSHDLRNPLVTIRGFTSEAMLSLQQQNFTEAITHLNRIEIAAEKMSELLTALLSYTRSGRELGQKSHFALHELIAEVQSILAALLKENATTFHISMNRDEIFADKLRLGLVFQNLIENSIKFRHPKRMLTIQISTHMEDAYTCIVFKDNGIGIPVAYQKRIFGLFEKLNPDMPGTGLGLTLSKRIIELHNGTLELLPSNEGAAFQIKLPVH